MLRGIFAMCHHTDQHIDALECHTNILQRNHTTIHNQRDDPLLELTEESIYSPILDPFASLTHTELASFGVGASCAPPPTDSDYDEDDANDQKTEDDE
jgi:hypothetical protein